MQMHKIPRNKAGDISMQPCRTQARANNWAEAWAEFRRQIVRHALLECPGFNHELRVEMWAGMRETDLTKLSPALASEVSKVLLATGELLQFRHLNKADASDTIDSCTGGRRLVARDRAT